MKGNWKRMVSGVLTAVTLMSTVLQPMVAGAADLEREEKKPPLYEEVKELLDEDEVVMAKDYEMEVGYDFDVKTDFSNIEIPDKLKVSVTFEEAKNEAGEDFVNDHVDTYKAVYYVEPLVEGHPKYQISRKLIVKEPAFAVQSAAVMETALDVQEAAGPGQETDSGGEAGEEDEPEPVAESESVIGIEAAQETEPTDEAEPARETECSGP